MVNERNADLEVETLLGVSVKKVFIPSIANTVGTNFKKYKIVRKNQFTYIPDTSRRGDKIGLALLKSHESAIVSQAYTVFEIMDQNNLSPEYLMMWFRRPEFDRYARYKSHGSVREIFDWEEMCDTELPIPSIEKQQEIVNEYNTITNRINLNEQLNQNLEETAQALYKHWFIDFEFPNEEGNLYKSSEGTMVYNEELDKEIPYGCESNTLDKFCDCLDNLRKPLAGSERKEIQGDFPYYGAMSIVDYINDFIFDGTFLLVSEDGANVVDERGRPATQYVWGKFWLNNHAHIIKGKEPYSTEYLKLALFYINASHLVTGAAQPKINQKNLMSITLLKSSNSILSAFNELIQPIFRKIVSATEEIKLMKEIKALLLSKMTKVEEKELI